MITTQSRRVHINNGGGDGVHDNEYITKFWRFCSIRYSGYKKAQLTLEKIL